jgi:hypothetical protein
MITVKRIKNTCGACPSQWEGTTESGDSIYIRLRHGSLRVDLKGDTIYHSYPDGFDGCMNYEELKAHVGHLLELPESDRGLEVSVDSSDHDTSITKNGNRVELYELEDEEKDEVIELLLAKVKELELLLALPDLLKKASLL